MANPEQSAKTSVLATIDLTEPVSAESNPWVTKDATEEETTPKPRTSLEENPVQATTPKFEAKPEAIDPKDVLNEFDPLASDTERAAQKAWSETQGHPPQSPIPPEKDFLRDDLPAPPTPPKTLPVPIQIYKHAPKSSISSDIEPSSASSFAAAFPAFIQKTISGLSRPQTPSQVRAIAAGGGNGPDAVPSPTTLVSLARQQRLPMQENAAHEAGTSSVPAARPGSAEPPQFDFGRFLDQLKSRSAEPVAKYFRSFLNHFSKRTFSVNDQVKLVRQFLVFIEPKMRESDVWRKESEAEFEHSLEAMEKLVMNRIYDYTFTPQIHSLGRQVTTDDLERDHVLSQRIKLFTWIEEKHLDIPEGESNAGFLNFAKQEILKINHYKAPRDKIICILNCCKVIFGLIRNLGKKEEQGADAFLPVLILVVLQSNPEHLLSNVEYIQRFRSPQKLQSEAGYYLSSLMGAVSFIETMDHSSLSNITQQEFESNVETAIQTLPPSPSGTPVVVHQGDTIESYESKNSLPEPPMTPSAAPAVGEESATALQLPTPASIAEDTRNFFLRTGSLAQETISKPLNAIGRIFSEALDNAEAEQRRREQEYDQERNRYPGDAYRTPGPQIGGMVPQGSVMQTPYKARVRPGATPGTQTPEYVSGSSPRQGHGVLLPVLPQPNFYQGGNTPLRGRSPGPRGEGVEGGFDPITAAVGEIEAAHRTSARETIRQMFPETELDVIDMILEANGGDVGRSIDSLLEISSG